MSEATTVYATVKEFAYLSGMTELYVRMLCREGKLGNAFKDARGQWQIPASEIRDKKKPRKTRFVVKREDIEFNVSSHKNNILERGHWVWLAELVGCDLPEGVGIWNSAT